jgi:Ni/Fe-hydrogenase subunit HybB-like protein
VVLYSGMVGIVVVYLWTMFERRYNAWSKPAGIAALVWRFVLTTGTGSIFGFLVARQAYQSALLAPLFIVLSFGWGLAVFLIVQSVMYRLERPPACRPRSAAAWRGCSVSSSPRRCTWWRCTT